MKHKIFMVFDKIENKILSCADNNSTVFLLYNKALKLAKVKMVCNV